MLACQQNGEVTIRAARCCKSILVDKMEVGIEEKENTRRKGGTEYARGEGGRKTRTAPGYSAKKR